MARARIDVSGISAADAELGPIMAGKIVNGVSKTHVDLGERKIVVVAEPREPWVRVRVTAYKVRTSQGRFLGGDIATLPATEAETLVTEGKAKPA